LRRRRRLFCLWRSPREGVATSAKGNETNEEEDEDDELQLVTVVLSSSPVLLRFRNLSAEETVAARGGGVAVGRAVEMRKTTDDSFFRGDSYPV
jgi:hypothetical protein